jgi:hypothetical protein
MRAGPRRDAQRVSRESRADGKSRRFCFTTEMQGYPVKYPKPHVASSVPSRLGASARDAARREVPHQKCCSPETSASFPARFCFNVIRWGGANVARMRVRRALPANGCAENRSHRSERIELAAVSERSHHRDRRARRNSHHRRRARCSVYKKSRIRRHGPPTRAHPISRLLS